MWMWMDGVWWMGTLVELELELELELEVELELKNPVGLLHVE